jgi:hypothetical protein
MAIRSGSKVRPDPERLLGLKLILGQDALVAKLGKLLLQPDPRHPDDPTSSGGMGLDAPGRVQRATKAVVLLTDVLRVGLQLGASCSGECYKRITFGGKGLGSAH